MGDTPKPVAWMVTWELDTINGWEPRRTLFEDEARLRKFLENTEGHSMYRKVAWSPLYTAAQLAEARRAGLEDLSWEDMRAAVNARLRREWADVPSPNDCTCREAHCPHEPFFGWPKTPEDGLAMKYVLFKANGNPLDPKADYFVLRLDTDESGCIAALAYAQAVVDINGPNRLSDDLRERVDQHAYQRLRRMMAAEAREETT